MSTIIYEEENVKKIRDEFISFNADILESLKLVFDEMNNMSLSLNTPKSSKFLPSLIEYYKEKVDFVQKHGDIITNDFNNVINEYAKCNTIIRSYVGDKNDK